MRVLMFFSVLFVAGSILSQGPASPAEFQAAFQAASSAFQASATYENAWRLAKAAYEHSTYGLPKERVEERKAVLDQGKNAAQRARELNPRGVEGHYWFGVNLGSWAETRGVMASLFAVGDILAATNQAVALDPGYRDASPLVLRGRVFHKAPGWPVSSGDRAKAEADFRRAMNMAGDQNRTLHRFLGELLLDLGRRDEARRIIQKGIALPADAENPYSDRRAIREMRELLEKM